MTGKKRVSASVDADLVAAGHAAVAGGEAPSFSAWVTEALRRQTDHDRRVRAFDEFLVAYEAEHGEITEDEMREAERSLTARAVVVRGNPPERHRVTVVLDAGAFIAVEQGDRSLIALLTKRRLAGDVLRTHGGVVGRIWRGGSGRQVPVARLLAGVEVDDLSDELGRRCGLLLTRARTNDVVDAAVVLLAVDGDEIVTSDPEGLAVLAAAADLHVDLIPV